MAEVRTGLSTGARKRRAAVGALMIVAGVATLVWLVYIGNSTSRAAERALIAVGLAGGALISATAQAAILIGAWMFWTARRRDRRRR